MEIIPAIDIIEGKCVRLTGGDYGKKKVYNEDPVAAALNFSSAGIRRLHLVDLDGAKAGRIVNRKVLEAIASKTDLTIDFGGGLKREEDINAAFESGASMVTGGSVAVKNPDLFLAWLEKWGAERIILGADAREGKIAVSGWLESSTEEIIPFILKYRKKGIRKVISTDISRDGMMSGPAVELYGEILYAASDAYGDEAIHLIASGGIRNIADLEELSARNLSGAIIGKALYEGTIRLDELASWIENQGGSDAS